MFTTKNESQYIIGQLIGYLVAYMLSSTALYLVLSFFGRLPRTWELTHVLAALLGVTLAGEALRKWLG